MLAKRRLVILRVVGIAAVVLALGTIAVLAQPQWREFFAEIGIVISVLITVRAVTAGLRDRFLTEATSPFEWALRRERVSQKAPSQLVTAISMASLPDRSTFELLAGAVDRRLHERFGFGLDDDRARDTLGSDVYEMLRAPRASGAASLLPRRKRGFVPRYLPAVSRLLNGARTTADPSAGQRSGVVDEVRAILNCLEKL